MPARPVAGVSVIRRAEYAAHCSDLPHLFLAGNLQLPTPHPYFQRPDVEVILCTYEAGNTGPAHWHQRVDEIEMVLEGEVHYTEFPGNVRHQFQAGDLVHIPQGTCVRRSVPIRSRTLALKLPSDSARVTCAECDRACAYRSVAESSL